jgi:hypothetical protein
MIETTENIREKIKIIFSKFLIIFLFSKNSEYTRKKYTANQRSSLKLEKIPYLELTKHETNAATRKQQRVLFKLLNPFLTKQIRAKIIPAKERVPKIKESTKLGIKL